MCSRIRPSVAIFYSDMNLFQEAWLGETADHSREAVVHTTGKRNNGSGARYMEKTLRQSWGGARTRLPRQYSAAVGTDARAIESPCHQTSTRDVKLKLVVSTLCLQGRSLSSWYN